MQQVETEEFPRPQIKLFKCGDCAKVNCLSVKSVILLDFIYCVCKISSSKLNKSFFKYWFFYFQEFPSKKNVAQHIRDVHTDHYFKCNDCHKVLM